MPRLSRRESQARTRAGLLAAAARVLSRKGLQGASIDEVAQEAGYTKGAFYANFRSKEELFLALLDQHFAEHIEVVERELAGGGPLEQRARAIGADFDRSSLADPGWQRLFLEFAVHATRDAGFRDELQTRYRALRRRITELQRRWAAESEMEPALPYEDITLMTCAMANGASLERLIGPGDAPDDLYGRMLEIFVAGLRARSQVASGP